MRRIRAAWALLACVANSAASGQQTQDTTRVDTTVARGLDPVVVTASRRPQRASDAPVITELVSRDDIERSGAQDLHAVLTQFVGIQPQAAVAASGGVQLEGLSSSHVLVLVDGQPLVGRIDGTLDVSRVPAWIIDHVEVIKGPLSTLYGSSAMGGVINVVTRDAALARPMLSAHATTGSLGRFDASASVRGGVDDLHAIVGIGRRQDNVQPGRADQSGARARRWDGSAKIDWSPGTSGVSLETALLGVRDVQRWQSGQLYYFSNNTQGDARATLTMPLGDIARRGVITAYYSRFEHLSRQATRPDPVSGAGDVSVESLGRLEATYTGAVTATETVDAGVALNRESLVAGRIVGGRRSGLTAEPYAQYSVARGAFSVVPGLRVSLSDQWGAHVTPRLAALYRAGHGVVLRASAARGYRAPDFKELYITFLNGAVGYVVHGNPDLRPETSANLSGGIEWAGTAAYVRVHGYQNRFSDFIESVQAPDSGGVQEFTYANVARGETAGIDLDAGFTRGRMSVDASYGLLRARDRETGRPLLGTVPRSARIAASLELPGALRPSMTALYWSAAPMSETVSGSSGTVVYRAAFARLDARIARRLTPDLDVQIGVMNLTSARPLGWPGETARRWYVGVELNRGF